MALVQLLLLPMNLALSQRHKRCEVITSSHQSENLGKHGVFATSI
jgi:hypothetical protein